MNYKGVKGTVVRKILTSNGTRTDSVLTSTGARDSERGGTTRLKVELATSGGDMTRFTSVLFLTMGPRCCRRIVTRVGSAIDSSRVVISVTPNGSLS